MKFLLAATLLVSTYAMADNGCNIDPTGNGAVGDLKDVKLQFAPLPGKPSRVCTAAGDSQTCIWTEGDGKTPCYEITYKDGSTPDKKCGSEALKEQNDSTDKVIIGHYDPSNPSSGNKQLGFGFYFTPDQYGKYIIAINPKDQQGNIEKHKDLKIEPSEKAGTEPVTINTYDGGTIKSRFAINVSSQLNGTSSGNCDQPIKLVGQGSANRDPNGNFYPGVANGSASDNLDTTPSTVDPHAGTLAAGTAN